MRIISIAAAGFSAASFWLWYFGGLAALAFLVGRIDGHQAAIGRGIFLAENALVFFLVSMAYHCAMQWRGTAAPVAAGGASIKRIAGGLVFVALLFWILSEGR